MSLDRTDVAVIVVLTVFLGACAVALVGAIGWAVTS